MKIKKSNKILWLICSLRDEWHSFPPNLCSYFWWSVAAIVTFPFAIIGHIYNYFQKDWTDRGKAAPTIFIYLICFAVTPFILAARFGLDPRVISWWIWFIAPYGLLLIIAIDITIIVLIVLAIRKLYAIYLTHKKPKKEKPFKLYVHKKPNAFVQHAISFKDKHCPIIKYED